ncbi:hypothetical protein OG562_35170 [Streptomyces sp. NBC_01275]|uniref:hypothetical protein n=1 Tax=Streptomyces sp. NBC_01275 TaxID=2903807 RepID=UPI0022560112|nr:hypothetical protein [Streptomyces sp. NBC_01275]MCX4766128.1 hypothetical protein [Streptomyces sp. NBC_01275]
MAVDQLPGRVREFANYLNGLLARLDQGAGWCAVFWQRDPDGMQACLEGREVPPWDVVEALLQDLSSEYGTALAGQEAQQVRPLHSAALAAYDARPGGRESLGDRLDVMLREQRYAVERQAELGRRLAAAASREEADAIRLDLAWAHDDHERATARCAELRYRMAELDRNPGSAQRRGAQPVRAAEPHPDSGYGAEAATAARPGDATVTAYDTEPSAAEAAPGPTPAVAAAEAPAPDPASSAPLPKQRKRRRGSARFAGMAEEEAAPVAVPPVAEPVAPAPAPAARRTPRGARFAGAAEEAASRSEPQREPLDAQARRETVEAVEHLVRLRGEGRSGEAHALLVELAYWPAARIPLLAAELRRAGLTADWTTLLWEAASLPADRLVAAADALVAVGRTADGEQILRQGVARPAAEIGQAVLALVGDGRRREAGALLDAYVRVRTPEEAARSVAPDPQSLVPLLLQAARGVSEERHWDLVHALRVAGFTA